MSKIDKITNYISNGSYVLALIEITKLRSRRDAALVSDGSNFHRMVNALDSENKTKFISDYEALKYDKNGDQIPNVEVKEKKVDGKNIIFITVKSNPISIKLVGSVIGIVAILIISAFAYTTFIQEHPMENLEIYSSTGLYEVEAGHTYPLYVDILPDNTTHKDLEWDINNKSVSITETDWGYNMYVGPGVSDGEIIKITVTSKWYDLTDSIEFRSNNNISIALSSQSTNLSSGESFNIILDSGLADVSNHINWVVSEKFVDFTSEGNTFSGTVGYDAKKGQSFTVTAMVAGTNISKTMKFTVTNAVNVSLSASSSTLSAGQDYLVSANITGYNGTCTYQWSVSGPSSEYVPMGNSVDGKVAIDAKKGQKITVILTIPELGLTKSIDLQIASGIGIRLNSTDTTPDVGQSFTITANVDNNLDGSYTWSADKNSMDYTTNGNKLTGKLHYDLKSGMKIPVTVKFSGAINLTETITLSVGKGLSISISSIPDSVNSGDSFTAKATVSPSAPSSSSMKWSAIMNGSVISVKSSSNGTATITVPSTADNGSNIEVKVELNGYNVSDSAMISVYNENQIPIYISDAQGILGMQTSPHRNYIIQNNIDMSDVDWVPFDFHGTLDGNGNTISGLTIISDSVSASGAYYAGLISTNYGTISDLNLENAIIEIGPNNKGAATTIYAGAIAANNKGSIEDCSVKDSTIRAHSTNIQMLWLSTHSTLPVVASGEARDGDWYDYASLKFTGSVVTSWKQNQKMIVYGGGISGYNAGTIENCDTVSTYVESKVINFMHDGNASANNAQSYSGGITGYSTSTIINCNSNGTVKSGLILHDSGDGDGVGLGYTGTYYPKGYCYSGGIAGAAKTIQSSTSSCTVSVERESFAPVYCTIFLPPAGAHYDSNMGSKSEMIAVSNDLIAKQL